MRITNKKARLKYHFLETYEAGIVLTGEEVKAVKTGQVDLSAAFAKAIDGEIFLINANLSGAQEPTRSRKLLLHKKQILTILTKVKAKKLTLVPVAIYTRGQLIKVKLALARHKKKHEKRQVLRERAAQKAVERELKTF